MITRLRLALSLLRCALFHDVRKRQGAYRCHTCEPVQRRGQPQPVVALIEKAEEL